MSQTIRGARHLAGLGVLLVLGLVALEVYGARESTLDLYVSLAEFIVTTLATILTAYAARNLPLSNRAPTSAEIEARTPRALDRVDTDAGA